MIFFSLRNFISLSVVFLSVFFLADLKTSAVIVNREYIPKPRLIHPTGETVSIAGEKAVRFVWSPHEGSRVMREYYDLRLYRGYETYEKNLILKIKIDAGSHMSEISADYFNVGEIYTWTLRQIYYDARKSDRSFSSFKISD